MVTNTSTGGEEGEGEGMDFFSRVYVKNRASLSVPCAGFREPVQPEARRVPNKSGINYAGHAKHVVF